MLRVHKGKRFFFVTKIRFVTLIDLIECLKQILLISCAPISELPSSISTDALRKLYDFTNQGRAVRKATSDGDCTECDLLQELRYVLPLRKPQHVLVVYFFLDILQITPYFSVTSCFESYR